MTESTFYEIPIEIRALKTASVYVVRTDSNTFLIDSGMRPSTEKELKEQGLDTGQIDGIILTHLHVDHIGGAMAIKKHHGSAILMGRKDAELCLRIGEDPTGYLGFLESYYRSNGVSKEVLDQLVIDHPMRMEYARYNELEVDQMVDDTTRPLNDPQMSLLMTPGHSPGSISPYLGNGEIFVGDLVLRTITPNISFYDESTDMLSIYLESLAKLKTLNFSKVNPGHGAPFSDLNTRIGEIEAHHRHRLDEVLSIIRHEPATAFQVTLQMRWSRGRTLESMNEFERNFAFGEAVSHIRKLTHDGLAEPYEKDGITYFRVQ